jgi:hypothetical protein
LAYRLPMSIYPSLVFLLSTIPSVSVSLKFKWFDWLYLFLQNETKGSLQEHVLLNWCGNISKENNLRLIWDEPIFEDPTVTVKYRTEIKALFLYFNLICAKSIKLDSTPCSFTFKSFLIKWWNVAFL